MTVGNFYVWKSGGPVQCIQIGRTIAYLNAKELIVAPVTRATTSLLDNEKHRFNIYTHHKDTCFLVHEALF